MAKKQPLYIFCDTAKSAEAGILQESRRRSLDGTRVVLHEDDFKLYFPVINEETGEIALTLEDKAKIVDGRILTTRQAQREILTDKWNPENEKENE